MRLAAVEGGGQSWVCVLSENSPDNIVEKAVFVTETPEKTLGAIRVWLGERSFEAIGIASFGPIDARKASPMYGYITSTPKEGWTNTNVLQLLGMYDEFKSIPYIFDTDVNAPALAEYLVSVSSEHITSCAYITIGTGVGVGLVVNGKTVHGMLHPEAGHIIVSKHPRDTFTGVCKFHQCCVEGMCSSVAAATRAGVSLLSLPELPDTHEVWDFVAYYIASLCATLILVTSPEKIILGGGIMNRSCLFVKIREYVVEILNNYIQIDVLKKENIGKYIIPSRWGSNAGIIGAAYLAKDAKENQKK